ncbi:hypothetical protein ACOME3_001849 [Neoechinorhynchus agilis]
MLGESSNGRLSLGVHDSSFISQATIDGFDYTTEGVFLYPSQSERSYQLNIVEKSLLRNTMVVLPTGLGKTFIATVVIYNFYRWYPKDKVIFLAPTKPLVVQQSAAFQNLTNLPSKAISSVTGSTNPTERLSAYNSEHKRVFFMTPQVLANDLIIAGSSLASSIRCVVFDEAHRATGNYAYVKVIELLCQLSPSRNFRVLALTATPGSDHHAIQSVIDNLLIAHIELRTEESIDVAPYMQQKHLKTVQNDH